MPIALLPKLRVKARSSLAYLRVFLEDELDRRRASQIEEYIDRAEKAISALEDIERLGI